MRARSSWTTSTPSTAPVSSTRTEILRAPLALVSLEAVGDDGGFLREEALDVLLDVDVCGPGVGLDVRDVRDVGDGRRRLGLGRGGLRGVVLFLQPEEDCSARDERHDDGGEDPGERAGAACRLDGRLGDGVDVGIGDVE
jgi:hypothetical protein